MSALLLGWLAAHVRVERGLSGWAGPGLDAQRAGHEEMW